MSPEINQQLSSLPHTNSPNFPKLSPPKSAPYPHPKIILYVKDQPGHSSIRMTVDTYGHLVPGANRQAVNKLPSLNESEAIELPLKRQQ